MLVYLLFIRNYNKWNNNNLSMETNEPEGFLNYFRINLNYSKLFTSAIRNSLKWTFWRFYSLFWANAESDPFFYKNQYKYWYFGEGTWI